MSPATAPLSAPAPSRSRLLTPLVLALSLVVHGLAIAATAEPAMTYTVQPGDKLAAMSRDLLRTPGDWAEVARFNSLPNANIIKPGQTLQIPVRLMKFRPVASQIVSVSGDVQVGGVKAQVSSPVNEGQQVQVGPNSSAVVELADGSRLKLLPNTQAEVAKNRFYSLSKTPDTTGSPNATSSFSGLMRLARGSVEALASKISNRSTPLEITTPTAVAGVRGTHFRVSYDDNAARSTRTEVLEGLVRADNPAQASGADLPRGTGAVIDPAKKEVKVLQLLAAPDLSALPAEVSKPQGRWPMPVLAGAASYRVQVARDAQFDQIVRDQTVAAAASLELASLAPGAWYARVRGIDAAGLEGRDAVRQIALKGAWLAPESVLMFRDGKTDLAWNPVQADGQRFTAPAYSTELATDSRFANVVARIDSEPSRVTLGDLRPGTYYVRLNARLASGTAGSETYSFEVPAGWGLGGLDRVPSALRPVAP